MGCLVALVGCQAEYSLQDDPTGWGQPNPTSVQAGQQTDRLLQVVEPVVDVLWLIDNSPSMMDDRRALAAAFPAFLEPFELAGVDWHIGVITTDMQAEAHRGRLQARRGNKWLQPDTPAASTLFQEMVTSDMGHGSMYERGREAAWTALELEADGYNAGFLRDDPGAWLHITVVTDEDDDSDDLTISTGRFADFVDLLRPYSDRTTFNSVVAMADDGAEERGDAYIELSSRIGGSVYDLNGSDWSTLLDELGGLQAPEPMTEFFLSRVPIIDTVSVHTIEPSGVTIVYDAGEDWVWSPERNSVQFTGPAPTIGSTIEVTYEVAGELEQ